MLAVTRPVAAQPPDRVVRIGRLSPLSPTTEAPLMDAFRKGLQEHGWVEGQHYTIELRFAEGKIERLPRLAESLVQKRVDVILAGSTPGVLAAKNATTTIPVVMVTTGDPIGGGLVASLARPGGNVTGVTALGQVLSAKRLEALRDAVPSLQRVAVLTNPDSPYTKPFLAERERTARELGIQLPVLEARKPGDLEPAFTAIAREGAGAIMVLTDVMFITHRKTIVELAARHRLPAVYGERQFVDAGGLMFYGATLANLYHDAASYADRILKGARPADLPVEQPTKLELVINLKAARALGLTIPPSVIGRADHLVE